MLYLLYNIYINLTIKINFMQKMNMSKFQCYSTIKEGQSKQTFLGNTKEYFIALEQSYFLNRTESRNNKRQD